MWINAVQMALAAFRANKVRTGLTMLGIVIGTAAVVALMAIGAGFRAKVEREIASLGSNVLAVYPGSSRDGHPRRGSTTTLTLEDAQAAAREIEGLAAVAPQAFANLQAGAGKARVEVTVVGTSADYPSIRVAELASGRFFNAAEAERSAPVAVLGHAVAERLIGEGRSAQGNSIRLQGKPFAVIGIFEPKGASGFTRRDDQVFVPLGAVRKRLSASRFVNLIDIAVDNRNQMDRVSGEIERMLMRRHGITRPEDRDFVLYSQRDLAEVTDSVLRAVQVFLAVTALISLLVGGVGIMNIMLVSVTERTREIGLMKAVGATRAHIRLQFLIEAITLCLLGGVGGVLLGTGASAALTRIWEWQARFTPLAYGLALGFSLAVGLFFGLYPAVKAARLNPIEALRHE